MEHRTAGESLLILLCASTQMQTFRSVRLTIYYLKVTSRASDLLPHQCKRDFGFEVDAGILLSLPSLTVCSNKSSKLIVGAVEKINWIICNMKQVLKLASDFQSRHPVIWER